MNQLVVMGASLGGLEALEVLLSRLPAGFPAPVVLVQHRGAERDTVLVEILQKHCVLPVTEPEDKEPILAGRVYIAPADYHLLVEVGGSAGASPFHFALSVDEPVNYSRPSIDVTLESAAEGCGQSVIAVILTGAGRDGAMGAARVKECGGVVLVQDPATAVARAMPEATLLAAEVDQGLALEDIAETLATLRS